MRKFQIIRKLSFILLGLVVFCSAKAQVGQIIWQENFNTLDTTLWNTVTGNGCDQATGCGWGNQELEYYQKNNIVIEDIAGETGNKALVILAKKETVGTNQFTSGKMTSTNKMAVKYGLIEVRMKTPNVSTGLWPAFWLLGTNQSSAGWPKCGEIDMMEMGHTAAERTRQGSAGVSANNYVGSNLIWYSPDACAANNPTCAGSIAYDTYYDQPYVSATGLDNRFLIYRLYWDEKSIRFTVEDNGSETDLYTGPFPIGANESAFTKPFYFILNLAVGGNFTDAATPAQVTAPLPAKMLIDYIRVRKWNGQGEVMLPGQIIANAGADQTLTTGTSVSLDASGSYGKISSYVWTESGTQIATGKNPTIALTSGTHVITLTVTDSNGVTATDEVSVQVGSSLIGDVIWEDNFDSFNSEIWNTVVGNGCDGESGCGFGNHELEYYNSGNVYIAPVIGEAGNNALVLEAKKETVGSNLFTSGKLTTLNKLAIKYGVVEVRMKAPDVSTGLWPAAWLLGTNLSSVGWPKCGEIDMMEMGHKAVERERLGHSGISPNNYVASNLLWYTPAACAGDNPTCAASIAYDKYYNKPYTPASGLNNRYVKYRMYWDESSIRFTVIDNGTETDLYASKFPIGANEAAFQQPFYFLLDLAVGGDFTDAATADKVTAPLPGKMYVDYVRVSKWKGKGEVSYNGGLVLANAGVDQSKTDLDKNGTESITLDGSASYGSINSYVWTESGAQIATGKKPTLNLPTGDHYITLTATDNDGKTSTDEVHVEVREIIWEDNFNSFDSELWNTITGDGCASTTGCGWGNQELENYQASNVTIEPVAGEANNSALILQAKKETIGTTQFTSGKITTENKVSIKYGLIEVRMKTPNIETGLWPAAWLLGVNLPTVGWPKCGEIDMMEMGQSQAERTRQGFSAVNVNNYVGSNLIWYETGACNGANPTCAASIAADINYDKPYTSTSGLNNRFVIYRLYWENSSIRFTVEDNGAENDLYTGPFPISTASAAFQQPFYFLLNLAVGGNFTDANTPAKVTATLPGKMEVDYVRVLRYKGKGEVAFKTGLSANAGSDIIAIDKDKNGTESVYLDGSRSSDMNGSITSYSWKENGAEIATGLMPLIELSRGVHNITLTVTDNDANAESDNIIVTVTTGGSSPTAVAGKDSTVIDKSGADLISFTLDGLASSDPNDSPLTYSWKENNVELATTANPTLNLSTGIHKITLTVTNEDLATGSDEIIITVIDFNNVAPVANAGADQTVNDNDGDDLVAVTLDGSGSSDSDGIIAAYSWKEGNEEVGTGVAPSVQLLTGKHKISLDVTDNDGVSTSDTVLITVVDPDNLAPVAKAGADTAIVDADRSGAQSFTLNGAASIDSDGTVVKYLWKENGAEISAAKTSAISLTVGLHTISLAVEDNEGLIGFDTIKVKVAQQPIAKAGRDTLIVDTNSDGSESTKLDGTTSSAPYGTIANYSWKENGAEIATGETAFLPFTIGTHIVTLVVTNNDGFTASDDVSVIIANFNNATPKASAGIDSTIIDSNNSGSISYTLDGSGSADSDGTIFSYQWSENDSVIATGKTPTIKLTEGKHIITLKVTDNEGAEANDMVIINIKKGICVFEACTKDYTARVISDDAGNSTITFIPAKVGTGDKLCLLYFETNPNASFPGNAVTPYQSFKVSNVTVGQSVYFYYTYSLAVGGEQTTNTCRHSFVVGGCFAEPNKLPVANAGADFKVTVPKGTASASVTLDGSASSDADGSITSYVWTEGIAQIATGVKPDVTLKTGSHAIYLIVTDNTGASARGKVTVTVSESTGTSIASKSNDMDVKLYPSPVSDILNIVSNEGKVEKIQVYNSYGSRVMEITNSSKIDMSELNKGLYIVVLSIDGKSVNRKVIKL